MKVPQRIECDCKLCYVIGRYCYNLALCYTAVVMAADFAAEIVVVSLVHLDLMLVNLTAMVNLIDEHSFETLIPPNLQ